MNVVAKKYLGQHFLHDQSVLKSILNAGELMADDTVLEIGSGKGVLTEPLLQQVKKVVAYEIDRDCFPILEDLAHQYPHLVLLKQSVLEARPPSGAYKVIANIPYYLTGTILRLFLHVFENQPQLMVLLIQKEVATKILSAENSLLSLAIQVYGKAELIKKVSSGAFTPPPAVDSAVIRITKHAQPALTKVDSDSFFRFLRPCFQGNRKQVQGTIHSQVSLSRDQVIDMLQKLGIDPRIRPSELNLSLWEQIVSVFLPFTTWPATDSVPRKS